MWIGIELIILLIDIRESLSTDELYRIIGQDYM